MHERAFVPSHEEAELVDALRAWRRLRRRALVAIAGESAGRGQRAAVIEIDPRTRRHAIRQADPSIPAR